MIGRFFSMCDERDKRRIGAPVRLIKIVSVALKMNGLVVSLTVTLFPVILYMQPKVCLHVNLVPLYQESFLLIFITTTLKTFYGNVNED